MADYDLSINLMQEVPKVISGPDGTVCVNPAVFHELVAFQDAINLGVILFVAGILLGAGLVYYRTKTDAADEEAEGD